MLIIGGLNRVAVISMIWVHCFLYDCCSHIGLSSASGSEDQSSNPGKGDNLL